MSFIVTAICVALAGWWGSTHEMGIFTAVWLALVLAVLEVSLSFDNAVLNAGVLKHMNAYWRQMFLTVGILIAVFGMRLVFPIVIVAAATRLGPLPVMQLALTEPDRYAQILTDSYPTIAAFGGMFLLMVFFNFIFDNDRELHWLGGVERTLGRLGKLDNMAVLASMIVLFIAYALVPEAIKTTVLVAGLAGVMLHIAVDAVGAAVGGDEGDAIATTAKRAGLGGFLYLEVLDASFSFDGVIGAFAITRDVVIIMLGLAIGAMFVRSMTVHLVNRGTLDEFVFLEHGAHYAIGVLAVILLVGTVAHVPEVVTGLIGVAFIAAAVWSSVRHKRREDAALPPPSSA